MCIKLVIVLCLWSSGLASYCHRDWWWIFFYGQFQLCCFNLEVQEKECNISTLDGQSRPRKPADRLTLHPYMNINVNSKATEKNKQNQNLNYKGMKFRSYLKMGNFRGKSWTTKIEILKLFSKFDNFFHLPLYRTIIVYSFVFHRLTSVVYRSNYMDTVYWTWIDHQGHACEPFNRYTIDGLNKLER